MYSEWKPHQIKVARNKRVLQYRKSAYFCCRLIFSDFTGEQDSQKYFS